MDSFLILWNNRKLKHSTLQYLLFDEVFLPEFVCRVIVLQVYGRRLRRRQAEVWPDVYIRGHQRG